MGIVVNDLEFHICDKILSRCLDMQFSIIILNNNSPRKRISNFKFQILILIFFER